MHSIDFVGRSLTIGFSEFIKHISAPDDARMSVLVAQMNENPKSIAW